MASLSRPRTPIGVHPIMDAEWENYQKYGRLYGRYEGMTPLLVIADPEMIKTILVKDFALFPDRRPIKIGDPTFDKSLLALKGDDWKRVRTIVTPTFSTGKMKQMCDLVVECSQHTAQNFLEIGEKNEVIDVKTYFGTLTMDAIASCAFGIKIESHKYSENPFVKNARNIFKGTAVWKALLFFTFPKLAKLLHIKLVNEDVIDFFKFSIRQIVEQRKAGTEVIKDFLQLMLECQKADQSEKQEVTSQIPEKRGDLVEEHNWEGENEKVMGLQPKSHKNKELSDEEFAGQCLMFFLAGYDTTASALTFAAYNLALYPECQERLIEEIDQKFKEKGALTYDDIGELSYLDAVVWETLRLYPPIVRTLRTAEVDYKLGNTGIVIPKNSEICIPIASMHRDSEFFPDPDRFDPLRFMPANKSSLKPYTYLPFGAGPRSCIGMRFALMETKIGLAYVLRRVRFRRCAETKVPPEFYPSMGPVRIKPIMLRVEKRADIRP